MSERKLTVDSSQLTEKSLSVNCELSTVNLIKGRNIKMNRKIA